MEHSGGRLQRYLELRFTMRDLREWLEIFRADPLGMLFLSVVAIAMVYDSYESRESRSHYWLTSAAMSVEGVTVAVDDGGFRLTGTVANLTEALAITHVNFVVRVINCVPDGEPPACVTLGDYPVLVRTLVPAGERRNFVERLNPSSDAPMPAGRLTCAYWKRGGQGRGTPRRRFSRAVDFVAREVRSAGSTEPTAPRQLCVD